MLFWSFFVHLSWSLLSVAVKFRGKARLISFKLFSYVKEEMERLDSRRVTRHDVNQCLSAVSVQKNVSTIVASTVQLTVVRKKTLSHQGETRQRNFSLQPKRIVFRNLPAGTILLWDATEMTCFT